MIAPSLGPFRERMKVHVRVRAALERRGYQEVVTKILQEAPGSDPEIEPMVTEYYPLMQPDPPSPLFLHTSPEFAMKRLLCRGLPAIYQIASVFRQGERGPLHSPEFSMVEWYRAGFSWRELMAEVEQVIVEVIGDKVLWKGREIGLEAPFKRVSVAEALAEAGANVPGLAELSEIAWLDKYYRAFVDKVEPWLEKQGPLFLTDFPAPLAIMSRLRPDHPQVAERFELIVAGLELGNGATELTDPEEHRRRFLQDREIRELTRREPFPLPLSFLHDLETLGLPPCAGVALGLDRLAMLATNSPIIDPVSAI